MAITSLILGIISFILGLIPIIGIVAIIPIVISIILGIVSLVKLTKNPDKNQSAKGTSICGIVLSTVGLVIMIAWSLIIYFAVSYFINYEDSFTEMLESDTVIEENIGVNKEIESYKDEIRENL